MTFKDKRKSGLAQHDAAQNLAIRALSYLAADPDHLVRFLEETGLTPAGLREAATQKGFAAGILAFILADEPLLLEFAAQQGLDPHHVVAAHELLSPGFDPDAPVQRAE
ncbi:DUF3572 domain-containing protein [Xanthobacter sp. TB0136]|uniref:DUF3572 domain-containing protein n=1 Tax=Xanthobacter sp. TB0136 TaxID=3459177 RepID=UPI004039E8C1